MKRQSDHMWKKIIPIIQKDKYYVVRHKNIKGADLHDHAFLEITYVLRGSVDHVLDGQRSILQPGDYFMVDYGSMHSYKATGEGFDNLDCLFLPELLDPTLKATISLRELFQHYLIHFNMQLMMSDPTKIVFHDDSGKIRELLFAIEKESEAREPGYTEMIRCYLLEILLLTLRGMEGAPLASNGHDIASFIVSYVSENYSEQINLSSLAERMNYSLPYVSKCFKDKMGISFMQYLQNYRVMQACRLLSTSRCSISEISEMVGYRDVKFFSSLVKRTTGSSPSKFRKENKSE